jgi:RES domain-containing protein
MVLWRVSNYASLDGAGGLLTAGRWHSKGRPVLYCAQNPATALLETLVHIEIDAEDLPDNFQVLKIEAKRKVSLQRVQAAQLPNDWPDNTEATRAAGDRWLTEGRSPLLEVPSILVPETWNVLVNPLHTEIALLNIVQVYEHPFDPRLFL